MYFPNRPKPLYRVLFQLLEFLTLSQEAVISAQIRVVEELYQIYMKSLINRSLPTTAGQMHPPPVREMADIFCPNCANHLVVKRGEELGISAT